MKIELINPTINIYCEVLFKYNFVNSNNGGMGVQDFFNRFIVNRNRPIIRPIRPIIKEIFDLSIYIILDNNIKFDLKTILSNVDSKHKIKTNSYSNNSNINLIQNEIKNELNESLIIIDKNSNLSILKTLLIPYIIYDTSNKNINDYISNAIESILFYKLQQNIK
jgi:hypothetical protein